MEVPVRYIPSILSKKDKREQAKMLLKSRRLYKKGQYYTRKRVSSYPHKTSEHIRNAQRIYGIDTIIPNNKLAKATGCKISALKKIVKKGEGAYFSSGSRPNQTAKSWGLARLASAVTGGKSAAVDYAILDKGCDHRKRAFILANQSRKKHGYGNRRTKKVALMQN
jgi:hypothetical protein